MFLKIIFLLSTIIVATNNLHLFILILKYGKTEITIVDLIMAVALVPSLFNIFYFM